MRKIFPVLVLASILAGCGGRVPEEVKTAMLKQKLELEEIKAKYRDSVDILFGQIRTLQLAIIAQKEEEFRQRYAIGCKMIEEALRCYDDANKPFPAAGPGVVETIIPVDENKLITDAFVGLRADTDAKLQTAKAEFMKLEDHTRIAQDINAAVTEYIESLVKRREAERELTNRLTSKLGLLGPAAAFQKGLLGLLVPDTSALDSKFSGRPSQ